MKKALMVFLMLGLVLSLSACADLEEKAARKEAFSTVGSIVTFGEYEQDDDKSNGKEPIEWIVLDVDGSLALLLSKNGLEIKPFMRTLKHSTWHFSDIRSWLDEEFYKTSFNEKEKKAISVYASITGPDQSGTFDGYSRYLDWPEDYTSYDRVFLLSYKEVVKYLPEEESRTCKPTDHVKNSEKYKDEYIGDYSNSDNYVAGLKTNGNCAWMLRTMPKGTESEIECVEPNGDVYFTHHTNPWLVVRPSIRVSLIDISY